MVLECWAVAPQRITNSSQEGSVEVGKHLKYIVVLSGYHGADFRLTGLSGAFEVKEFFP